MANISKKSLHVLIVTFTVMGCASSSSTNKELYPKASSDATLVLQLQSNQPKTHFFIDGKAMGIAKRLKILVNNQAHTIIAQADGCIKKEEFVQPPYNAAAPLGFTYLSGECDSGSTITSTNPNITSPSKPVTANPTTQIIIHNKQPPIITIMNFNLRGANEVNGETVTIQGQALDDDGVATVQLAELDTELDAEGHFSTTVPLKEGINNIDVIAVDNLGNKTEKTLTLKRKIIDAPEPIATPAALENETSSPNFGRYFALVIGNNNYLHLDILDTAENDAKEVAQVLKSNYGFTVNLLLSAKRSAILDAINEFKLKLNSNDNFLIYYAGHGTKEGSAYWLPIDAKADNTTEWIQAETLTAEFKQMLSEHILIISDSCYSGELSRGAKSPLKQGSRDVYLKNVFSRKSRTLIASGGDEPVSDGGGGNHSVFTKTLLKALTTKSEDVFTDEELFVSNIKEVVAGNTTQIPQYSILKNSGHEDGSFIFVKQK